MDYNLIFMRRRIILGNTELDKREDCFYNVIVSKRLRALTLAMKPITLLLRATVEPMVRFSVGP